MLNFEELKAELLKRSVDEKLAFIEFLAKSVRKELEATRPKWKTPAEKLAGIAKPDGLMPGDEELEEMRFNDLRQKYDL